MEHCNESGKRKKNLRIQPKYHLLWQQMILISTVARLEHLPPTLLLLCLASVPPLCPHRHPCPPPIHPGKVEGANTSGYGRFFVIRMSDKVVFQEQNGIPPQITPTNQSYPHKKEEVINNFSIDREHKPLSYGRCPFECTLHCSHMQCLPSPEKDGRFGSLP